MSSRNIPPRVIAIATNSIAPIPSNSRKRGKDILVMPAMTIERSEIPGKNFEKRSETGPILASRVWVWLTQKSGEKETWQTSARTSPARAKSCRAFSALPSRLHPE
jgi:hypothetical protein